MWKLEFVMDDCGCRSSFLCMYLTSSGLAWQCKSTRDTITCFPHAFVKLHRIFLPKAPGLDISFLDLHGNVSSSYVFLRKRFLFIAFTAFDIDHCLIDQAESTLYLRSGPTRREGFHGPTSFQQTPSGFHF